jgi:hypothetical protein
VDDVLDHLLPEDWRETDLHGAAGNGGPGYDADRGVLDDLDPLIPADSDEPDRGTGGTAAAGGTGGAGHRKPRETEAGDGR